MKTIKRTFSEIRENDLIVMDIGNPQTVDDVRNYGSYVQVCFKEQSGHWYNYDGLVTCVVREWHSVVLGIWKLSFNVVYGGCQVHRLVEGIGWVVASDSPPKHIDRRLVRKAYQTVPELKLR